MEEGECRETTAALAVGAGAEGNAAEDEDREEDGKEDGDCLVRHCESL